MKQFFHLFTVICTVITFASCSEDYEFLSPKSGRTEPADYRPFVVEGKTWEYGLRTLQPEMMLGFHKCQRKIEGDTLIQGRQYKKLFTQETWKDDKTWSYTGCLREESMTVFFMEAGKKKEILLYDFGLKVGDPIPGRNALVTKISRLEHAVIDPDAPIEGIPEEALGQYTPVDITYNPRVFMTDVASGGNKPAYIEGIGDPDSDVLYQTDDKTERVLFFCKTNGSYVYNKWTVLWQ